MTLTYALKFLLQDEEGDLLDVQVDQKVRFILFFCSSTSLT